MSFVPSLRRRAAFSLVELLVAMTVLTLMVLLFAQIISMVGQTTGANFRRADALGEGRMLLDRFGIDWDARVRRSELAPTFACDSFQSSGADTCTFYSQVNGFGSGALRPVSQIGYFVNNSSASYALQRWDNGTTWTTGNPLNFSTGTLAIGTSNYQTLADDVCRLQFTFQLKSNGQFVTTPPSSFSNVGAVVMAVALLDKVTRKQVAPAQVTQLVSALTAVGGAYTTPEDQWTANLAAATSLPKLITQNVRICQRTFYAN